MNNIARNILLAIATIIPSGNALAQIPDGYYDALKDKKGAELKTAVHNIIKNANVLDYGSGTELLHIARQVPERGSVLRWQRDQADRIQMACW